MLEPGLGMGERTVIQWGITEDSLENETSFHSRVLQIPLMIFPKILIYMRKVVSVIAQEIYIVFYYWDREKSSVII